MTQSSLSHPYQLWVTCPWYPNNGSNELLGVYQTLSEAQSSILAQRDTEENPGQQRVIYADLNVVTGELDLTILCYRDYIYSDSSSETIEDWQGYHYTARLSKWVMTSDDMDLFN